MTPTSAQAAAHAAALDLLREGDFVGAEALLCEAPQGVDVLHLRAVAAHRRQRRADAEDFIRRALALSTSDATTASLHNDLGNIRLEAGDPSGALAAYESSLALQPHDPPTLVNLATAMRRNGDALGSAEAGLAALALDPSSAPARHAVWTGVQSLAVAGRTDEALALTRRWHALDPDDPGVRHRLAALGGLPDPGSAPPEYVEGLFDAVAADFDPHLASLGYRAPELVAAGVRDRLGDPRGDLAVADVGCGTGLAGALVRPWAATLVGCDLSLGMLGQAQRRGCYDELFKADLADFLGAQHAAYDLVVCADTLCYLGDLRGFTAAATSALRPGGVLVATVESLDGPGADRGWRLTRTGRYAHHREHLEEAARAAGLADLSVEGVVLRHEGGQPVGGLLWAARRPTDVAITHI